MPFRLKKTSPDFQCCAGPFEGRKFVAGRIYAEIPPEEQDKFEEVTKEKPAAVDVRKHKKDKEE